MKSLTPFSPTSLSIKLSGSLIFRNSQLEIIFNCEYPETIALGWEKPQSTTSPARQDDLWKATCLEAFVAIPNDQKYFELNFSPSGAWNCYEFSQYRLPSPPKASNAFALKSMEVTRGTMKCIVECKIDTKEFDFSLCAVIRVKDQNFYFSTQHMGEKPDFHLRKSFSERAEHK